MITDAILVNHIEMLQRFYKEAHFCRKTSSYHRKMHISPMMLRLQLQDKFKRNYFHLHVNGFKNLDSFAK